MESAMNLSARLLSGLVTVAFAALAACGDGADITEPDINPALLDGSTAVGLAAGGDLPQGSAPFTGPDGLSMDATAEEFIQQLSLPDGRVWRTSGVSIRAVPDEAVAGAPIGRLGFSAAATGVLSSVGPGTYPLTPEWPAIDFINRIDLAIAWVREPDSRVSLYASGGTMTIQSLNYFDDVYTCTMDHLVSVTLTECSYQLGIVRGTIEFRAPTPDGSEVVQQRSEFVLPIMRRTIVAVMNQG
jgi:hypothetical protein